ncbi:hypothetical protein [Streptomyces albidoflavus]|uniref:hypothetical protein n=1 Tax=Streptomyces albidoflavus TaxID=1886 RepID=UPI0033A1737F
MIAAPRPQAVTRHHDGRIHVYLPADSSVFGPLEPAAVFRPLTGDEVVESAVRPDLERAVYTTLNGVVCLDRAGAPVWASEFAPRSEERHGHRPGCAYSLDGRTVWVYRPDAMAGRGRSDQWVVHDADTGQILARHEPGTAGHGAAHHVHPVDGGIHLDIGEGQDGSVVLRATIGADGEVEFVRYPWSDRCLVDVAPDGEHFMTVDHDQADVAFHRHPGGEALRTLSVEDFGHDPDGTYVEWCGGYLTPDTAVVALGGETEDGAGEWFRHVVVDVRTGVVAGELGADVANPYAVRPLGDGSWLGPGEDGHPVRHLCPPGMTARLG